MPLSPDDALRVTFQKSREMKKPDKHARLATENPEALYAFFNCS
jgi:hypothetical protein